MKNFYEATVTKPLMTLKVQLNVRPVGHVQSKIQINNSVWESTISQEQTYEIDVALNDAINILIQIQRKHPEALEVSLYIENREIIPKYLLKAEPQTSYIDSNSEWKIHIPNFYLWYHEVVGHGWVI